MNEIQDWLSIGNPDGEPFKVEFYTLGFFTFFGTLIKVK